MSLNKYIKKTSLLLILSFCSQNVFAGGIKGPLISDEAIFGFGLYVVAIHFITAIAYYMRIKWLRIISGILYLPLLAVTFIIGLFLPIGFLFLLIELIVYALLIIYKRK